MGIVDYKDVAVEIYAGFSQDKAKLAKYNLQKSYI